MRKRHTWGSFVECIRPTLPRAFASLLCLSSLVPVGAYGQDSPGHYQANTLPTEILATFIEAVRTDGLWKAPEAILPAGAIPSGEQRLLWSGSEINTSLTIGNPTVKFSKAAQHFELEIIREQQRFVLRSSAPSHPAFAAGVIAPYSSTSSYFKHIPGSNGTGFVALVPKMTPSDWYAIGVCPYERTKNAIGSEFSSSGFIGAAIRFEPRAEVSARQDTGDAKGKAYMSIHTTPNIARAVSFERSTEQASPRLATMYFTEGAVATTPLSESQIAGIKLFAKLISPAGNTRSKQVEGVVQILPFDLPAPIEFTQDGRKSSFEGKGCVAIVQGITTIENF
jgi:hypothetical protein